MNFIKASLCLEGLADYSCLKVFSAVANGAAFYQFIQEKQFVGEKGQALFHQQYQLITAQLQQEEYDDTVLNQLKAAFVFMTPFMDHEKSLKKLMTQVTQLDTSHGDIQLETVNENISLVRLWFSHAEVSHSLLLFFLYLHSLFLPSLSLLAPPLLTHQVLPSPFLAFLLAL